MSSFISLLWKLRTELCTLYITAVNDWHCIVKIHVYTVLFFPVNNNCNIINIWNHNKNCISDKILSNNNCQCQYKFDFFCSSSNTISGEQGLSNNKIRIYYTFQNLVYFNFILIKSLYSMGSFSWYSYAKTNICSVQMNWIKMILWNCFFLLQK